jgi:hypothetical protein
MSPSAETGMSAGRALLGLVVAAGILGVLAAGFLVSQAHAGLTGGAATSLPSLQSSHVGAAGDIDAASEIACKSDYAAVNAAVSAYEILNGKPPESMAALGSMLRGPVSSSRFRIVINPARPGQVEVAGGGQPPQPGDGACADAG